MGVGEILRREFTGRRLAFNVIFWGGHWGIFALGWYLQQKEIKLKALNTLTFSVWISRGAGLILSFDVMLILLPMCRNILRMVRPKIKWLPLDESIWFHRQVAYALLVFTICHVTAHYVNFFNVEKAQIRAETALHIHYMEAGGITGHTMLLCMMLMYTTAHHKIRQQSYEAFWYTHHLFIPFLIGMYTHATNCFVRDAVPYFSPFAGDDFWQHCIGYEGWRWELWTGGLYLIERIWREIRSRRQTKIVKVIKHPCDAVELQFSKPSMRYKAGQWLFINIPSVSRQQWHPFTITSCPFDPYVSIHMRQVGDWTKAAGDALGCGPAQANEYASMDPNGMYEVALAAGQRMPEIRIDGPYGAPAEDVFDNEIAVLIGTGIGVTPWAAILKNIWHMRSGPNPPTRLKRVEFVWVTKDTSSFEWFQTLLASLEEQTSADGSQFLKIHTYLTQKMDLDMAQNIYLNTAGAEKDPLTELRSRTNFGRPDWLRLLGAMKNGILNGSYIQGMQGNLSTKVGVYFCGPNAAARQIRQACRDASSNDVKFRFWKEHF